MPATEYYREVSYGRFASTQVTLSTAATQIVASSRSRYVVHVAMMGSQAVYIGTSSVTPTIGALLVGTVGAALSIFSSGAIFGATTAGTVVVSALEMFSS